jgi:hypothetical protein
VRNYNNKLILIICLLELDPLCVATKFWCLILLDSSAAIDDEALASSGVKQTFLHHYIKITVLCIKPNDFKAHI